MNYTHCVNGKWLAQPASGTQRYASQVMEAVSGTGAARDLLLVLPSDADEPAWVAQFPSVRSRFRGVVFEQVALPWISRGRHLYSMAGPAPLLKRNQTVVMHDAMPFRYPKTFRRAFVVWYWVMYGLLSRTAARVLTVSSFSRAELAETLRVPKDRFELAPCGSDHLGDGPVDGPELPFAPGTFALIVGNLAPHKNVQVVAAALADAELPVVVVGVAQQVFRSASIGGGENLALLGRVDDERLRQLYSAAAVLVAPSRYEGFGIPLVEAGRLGCPAVFALGSAMTEVAGEGGLSFRADDTAECVALVKTVIADPQLRRRLSVRARANATRFSWRQTARTIFEADGAAQPPAPLRVLHVTETFSAGTGTAIIEYARAMAGQGVDSYLLAHDRGSGLLSEVEASSPFAGARLVGPGLLNLRRALRAAVSELRPDVVHLHSSLAGAVGRLVPNLTGRPVIAYSPHCFAFERRDIPGGRRWAYRCAEVVLARRTDAFICVSPHEARLAQGLRSKASVHHVLNTFAFGATPAFAPTEADREQADPIRIVTVGRVAPQKDPALFAEIVAALQTITAVAATWVGDGPAAVCADLDAAGISVTGWLAAANVPAAIAGHTAYVHTAGWEASVPIAVLDAMNAGLPVVVKRNTAYHELLPDAWQFDDVATAAEMIRALAVPDSRRRRVREQFDLMARLRQRSPDLVMADIYRRIARLPAAGEHSYELRAG